MVSLALPGKSAKRVFALGDPAIHRDKQTSASGARGPRASPEDCARSLRDCACFVSLSFAGLVVLARSLNPIPSRTRPLNSSAPMVLWLKPWESRSLPGLPRTRQSSLCVMIEQNAASPRGGGVLLSGDFLCFDARPC